MNILTESLISLRSHFQAEGFDLRLVGGVVRDLQSGIAPKDIDLCTDATPDEQLAVYRGAGVRFAETGLQHGTITAILPCGAYEITSLRTETDHDGRHATVAYTRDWLEDLSRRDLTVNAMAMTFDGELIDPFGGQEDLRNRVARFVGSPDDRMREDYLRILRWLRFHGRLAAGTPLHRETEQAAIRNAEGLRRISRERIWSEMSRIVVGPGGPQMLASIMTMGLAPHMDISRGSVLEVLEVFGQTNDPVTIMVAFLRDPGALRTLSQNWRWSRDETSKGVFLVDHLWSPVDYRRLLAHDLIEKDWVLDLAVLQHRYSDIPALEDWDIPVFPVKGAHLLAAGHQPGKAMGEALKIMKDKWADSGYTLSKDDLIRG